MKLSSLPSHHAVLIVNRNRQEVGDLLWQELGDAPSMHKYINQSVLDIDTVRGLITWASTPYHGERVAIVSFHIAPHAAQNAMLKILEEPQTGIRFVLVTSNKEQLLDTVISRTSLIESEEEKGYTTLAREFLEEKQAVRMKLSGIVALLSQEDEEGRKDRESIRSFILSLVEVLAQEKKIKQHYIKETLEMASYAGDPSTSGKTIVEYLSLLLPVCGTIL